MSEVVFLEDMRLFVVDFRDWQKNGNRTTIWGEVVDWLFLNHNLLKDLIKKDGFMVVMDFPEGSVHDMGCLIQGLSGSELSESALIKQLESHASETIESFDKDALQRAIAGGKLLKSVLTLLVRQNFSPLGCLILANQDDEAKT